MLLETYYAVFSIELNFICRCSIKKVCLTNSIQPPKQKLPSASVLFTLFVRRYTFTCSVYFLFIRLFFSFMTVVEHISYNFVHRKHKKKVYMLYRLQADLFFFFHVLPFCFETHSNGYRRHELFSKHF